MRYCFYYDFPIGRIGVTEEGGSISRVFFVEREDSCDAQNAGNCDVKGQCGKDFELCESPLLRKAAKQLEEYFSGKRRVFDLPLTFKGTDFQKKVWEALFTIPYGETRTYGEMAAHVGNPQGCRAVGLANNRNPIVIICPCHRVIGKGGALTGYGGGLKAKEYLLNLEGAL